MGDDEAQVRAAAERLVAAFGSGRLDDYFACFADDATFVFYDTPQRLESVDAYRQLWDRWVRDDGFRVTGCVSSAVRVQVLGDAAVMVHDVVTDVETRGGPRRHRQRWNHHSDQGNHPQTLHLLVLRFLVVRRSH